MPDYGDLKLQLYYDGKWNDAPLADPKRGPVLIVRGRGPEQDAASPSTMSATVDNYSGDYNPHNPASDLYGKIGRNTPARVYLGTPNVLGDSNFSLSTATSQVAPGLTAPAAGLLVCAWAAPDTSATYTAPTGMSAGSQQNADNITMRGAREAVSAGATGTRTATLSTARDYVAASVFIKGPTSVTTGSITQAGTSITLDVDTAGDWWVLFAAYSSPGTSNTSDPPVAPDPSDTDGGGWVLLADTGPQNIFNNGTDWLRMKAWAKKTRTVSESHVISLPGADADSTIMFAVRVPADEVSGDWDIRHVGEVASWQPDRTGDFVPNTTGDAWTVITASGVLRRLSQGTPPVLSALRRTIESMDPLGYWPMEESATPDALSSALVGGRGFSVSKGMVDFGADDTLPGSLPLPKTRHNEDYADSMTASVPFSGVDGDDFTVTWWCRTLDLGGTDLRSSTQVLVWLDGGMLAWIFQVTYVQSAGSDFFDINGSSPTTTVVDESATAPHTNDWQFIKVTVDRDGSGDLRCRMWCNGTLMVTGTATQSDAGVTRKIDITIDTDDTDQMPVSMGHLAVFSSTADVDDQEQAGAGWTGETAVARFTRLCAEQGIPASVLGDPDDTVPMGPQPADTLINILAEIERTDVGILAEPRDQAGLLYRTRASLYNQTPALTLDWDDGRMSPLTPVLDDRYTRNDVSARRRDGSFARAVQESGPLNVQPPSDDVDGVGRYESEVDVNPETDAGLQDLAGWYLRLGTVDGPRFPQLTVDLDLYTAVAGDAATVDVGDRVTIINVPKDLAPDDIDLLVVGSTEQITPTRRTITFSCAPYAYDVAVYDTDRYDAKDAKLAVAATSSATSIAVSSTALWTGDDGDFDISVGGERMTVTAVSGTSSPQVFTVTRAVNGVSKAHAAGTPVRLWKTPRYAL